MTVDDKLYGLVFILYNDVDKYRTDNTIIFLSLGLLDLIYS